MCPGASTSPTDPEATCCFFRNERVSSAAILAPHLGATRARKADPDIQRTTVSARGEIARTPPKRAPPLAVSGVASRSLVRFVSAPSSRASTPSST
jgi:hypothetical protein